MNKYIVHRKITLEDKPISTGRTVHTVYGKLLPTPFALMIVKYHGDDGYYLLYLDSTGKELTDTYHETLDKALEQAEWEFGVTNGEWEIVS